MNFLRASLPWENPHNFKKIMKRKTAFRIFLKVICFIGVIIILSPLSIFIVGYDAFSQTFFYRASMNLVAILFVTAVITGPFILQRVHELYRLVDYARDDAPRWLIVTLKTLVQILAGGFISILINLCVMKRILGESENSILFSIISVSLWFPLGYAYSKCILWIIRKIKPLTIRLDRMIFRIKMQKRIKEAPL